MKHLKLFPILLLVLAMSCSSDDDTPQVINQEEVITTLTVRLNSSSGATPVILQSRDLDGADGSDAPVITIDGDFTANTVYTGTIELLNETETPTENITDEVEEESNEHQFFYTVGSGLNVTTAYGNFDDNNNPLGTQLTLTTGAASSGSLTFTLRHEPTKPNTGLSDAGGETDIEVSFTVSVQ